MIESYIGIKGFPTYQVGNAGSVRRNKNGKIYILKDRVYKRSGNRFLNYKRIIIYKEGKPYSFLIHRLVGLHFVSGHEEGLQINHKDGNSLNNIFTNLEWVTPSENVRHSFLNLNRNTSHCARNLELGRVKHPNSKLTEKEVIEIRNKYVPIEYSLNKLSVEYNVSKKLILLIIKNKIWKL